MKKITQYQEERNLADILAKAKKLALIDTALKKYLPEDLAAHCQVANLRHACLVVAVDNASWATQLRYLQNDILQQLREHEKLYQIGSIRCTIAKPKPTSTRRQRHISLTPQAANHLSECAAIIESDTLKSALLKLASNKDN